MKNILEVCIVAGCALLILVACSSSEGDGVICEEGLYYIDGKCQCLDGKNKYGGQCNTEDPGDSLITDGDADGSTDGDDVDGDDEKEYVVGANGLCGDMSGYLADSPRPSTVGCNSGNRILLNGAPKYTVQLEATIAFKNIYLAEYRDFIVGKYGNLYFDNGYVIHPTGHKLNGNLYDADKMSVDQTGKLVLIDDNVLSIYDYDMGSSGTFANVQYIPKRSIYITANSGVAFLEEIEARFSYEMNLFSADLRELGIYSMKEDNYPSVVYTNGSLMRIWGSSKALVLLYKTLLSVDLDNMKESASVVIEELDVEYDEYDQLIATENHGIFVKTYDWSDEEYIVSIYDDDLVLTNTIKFHGDRGSGKMIVGNSNLYVTGESRDDDPESVMVYRHSDSALLESVLCLEWIVAPNDVLLCSSGSEDTGYKITAYDETVTELWKLSVDQFPRLSKAYATQYNQLFIPYGSSYKGLYKFTGSATK